MLELDLRSRDPIYQQLVEKFKELIINNVLKKDEQLPSVRTLAQQLTINPNTIQKAYRELETQGYIYSVKGKGSFVDTAIETNNQVAIKHIQAELTKLMREALFLGLSKTALTEMINQIEEQAERGSQDD